MGLVIATAAATVLVAAARRVWHAHVSRRAHQPAPVPPGRLPLLRNPRVR